MMMPVGKEQVQFVWQELGFFRAFLEVPSRITFYSVTIENAEAVLASL